MKEKDRSCIPFHSFCGICIFHTKSCHKMAQTVHFLQKQRDIMQMEPVVSHIPHLSFHRLESTVCDQSLHFWRKPVAGCHQYSRCPHRLSIQIDWKLLLISLGHINCPPLYIPFFLCSKGDIFSFTFSTTTLFHKQKIALVLVEIFCHK